MKRIVFAAAIIAIGCTGVAQATFAHGTGSCCLCARKTCQVTVGREQVEEPCFEVECEDVCIPPVRFWWECGPIRRCGKVRTVRKLTTETATKSVCTYDWDVVTICAGCYRCLHRLRCRELGVGTETPAEAVGLPAPVPDDETPEEAAVSLPVDQAGWPDGRTEQEGLIESSSAATSLAPPLVGVPVRVAELPAE